MSGNPFTTLSDYERRHLVSHLAEASRRDDIRRLLAFEDAHRANAWFALKDDEGDIAGYAADLAVAVECERRIGSVAGQCRYALMAASMRSLSSRIPGTLLMAGVQSGRSLAWALAHARQAQQASERAARLTSLAPFAPAPMRTDLLREAFADIRTAVFGARYFELLAPLVARFTAQLPEDLLRDVHAHVETWPPYFSPEGWNPKRKVLDAVAEAFARLRCHDEALRVADGSASALAAIGRWLPPPVLERAITTADGLDDEKARMKALTALLPYLPVERALREVMALPRTVFPFDSPRAEALFLLAQANDGVSRLAVLKIALREAGRVAPLDRVRVQARLIRLFPEARQAAATRRVLNRIQQIPNPQQREQAFIGVLEYLPESQRQAAIDLAIAANRDVGIGPRYLTQFAARVVAWWPEPTRGAIDALTGELSDRDRREVLTKVVARLPEAERPAAFASLLAGLQDIGDLAQQSRAIGQLLPHVSARDGVAVRLAFVDRARRNPDAKSRAEALAIVAGWLSGPERSAVVAEALQAGNDVSGSGQDVHVFQSLAACADKRTRTAALDGLARFHGTERLRALLELLPALSQRQRNRRVEEALTLAASESSRDALYVLERVTPFLEGRAIARAWRLAAAFDDPLHQCEAFVHLWRPSDRQGRRRAFRSALAALQTHTRGRAFSIVSNRGVVRELSLIEGNQLQSVGSVRPSRFGWGIGADDHLRILTAIRRLSPAPRQRIACQLAASTSLISDVYQKVAVTRDLAPALPPTVRRKLLANALGDARLIDEAYGRAVTLALLADIVPAHQQRQVSDEAIAALTQIHDDRQKSRTFEPLAHTARDRAIELLDIAKAIEDEQPRAWALKQLAESLPRPSFADVVHQTLKLTSPSDRAMVLAALVARQPRSAPLRRQLLEAGLALTDRQAMVAMLSSLPGRASESEVAFLADNWGTVLAPLTSADRKALLEAMAAIAPRIGDVCGAEGTRDVVEGILDVGRWWP